MTDEANAKRKPGRPPGTGAVARLRRALLKDDDLDDLVQETYALAMTRGCPGQIPALRLLYSFALPPMRAHAKLIQVSLPAGTLTEKAMALLEAAAAGDLPADIASELIRSVAAVVGITEGDELRKRLDAIEHGAIEHGDLA